MILLHTVFRMYGGQRYPKIDSFKTLKNQGVLTEYRYVPRGATLIYISHEWTGTNHPDPKGDQMYHLLLLLERLQRGEVDRTDMNVMHSILYNHNCTTTAEEWKHILNSETTYVFYDGLCIPKEKREEAFRMTPAYVKRCDFTIILAPGCTWCSSAKRETVTYIAHGFE